MRGPVRGALTGPLSDAPRDGLPSGHDRERRRRHRRVPDHPPGEDHARAGRPAELRPAAGARACAARRSPRWPASASTTTSAWSAATSAASPSSCSRRSRRALQLDDAERAHLFDLARAASPVAPEALAAGQAARSARSCSASSTRSTRRRSCSNVRVRLPRPPTRSAARCTRRCSTAASSRPTARASRSWTRRRADFYPDWDRAGHRARRAPALRGRPQPLRPQPVRTSSASCRRAATSSASAGRRTTSASTGPAPSGCTTRSSASWSSATRRWSSTPTTACAWRSTPPSPARPPSRRSTCWPAGRRRPTGALDRASSAQHLRRPDTERTTGR